jgi:hypothetical protein
MHMRMMVDMPALQTDDERRRDAETVAAVARESLADPELAPFDIARAAAEAVTAALGRHGFRTDRWHGEGSWYQVEPTGRRIGEPSKVWVMMWPVNRYGHFEEEPRGWDFMPPQAIAFADRLNAWTDRLSTRPDWHELEGMALAVLA